MSNLITERFGEPDYSTAKGKKYYFRYMIRIYKQKGINNHIVEFIRYCEKQDRMIVMMPHGNEVIQNSESLMKAFHEYVDNSIIGD